MLVPCHCEGFFLWSAGEAAEMEGFAPGFEIDVCCGIVVAVMVMISELLEVRYCALTR